MTARAAGDRVWRQIAALLTGMAALAGIHAGIVVPSILDSASLRAAAVAHEAVAPVRKQLEDHLNNVEVIRSTLATKSEIAALSAAMERLGAQLDRMESRLAGGK